MEQCRESATIGNGLRRLPFSCATLGNVLHAPTVYFSTPLQGARQNLDHMRVGPRAAIGDHFGWGAQISKSAVSYNGNARPIHHTANALQ